MDDLVKRLRERDIAAWDDAYSCRARGTEAADAIEALQACVATARRDAFEEAAKVADQWATDQQRQFGNGGPAAAIRALAEKG